MFSDQIEGMKRQYTDKYVLVDGTRPELARFRDVVGRVKTVNMNGRALVEFDEYHLNTGWYDIDPEFLKVVDKPPPKPPKPEAKKAPAKAEAKPATAKAPSKAAAAQAGKGSVADILAAARAGKPAAPTAKAAPPAEAAPAGDAPKPAKVDRSKMSVADMLAAARSGGTGSAAAAAPAKPKAAPPPDEPEQVAEAPPAQAASSGGTIQRVDKSGMSIDDMLAYCREHDAK